MLRTVHEQEQNVFPVGGKWFSLSHSLSPTWPHRSSPTPTKRHHSHCSTLRGAQLKGFPPNCTITICTVSTHVTSHTSQNAARLIPLCLYLWLCCAPVMLRQTQRPIRNFLIVLTRDQHSYLNIQISKKEIFAYYFV